MDGARATRALVAASVGQLGLALAGLAIALRRGHAYDVPLLHGDPTRIVQQSVVMGTALSQPPVMMAGRLSGDGSALDPLCEKRLLYRGPCGVGP